MSKTQTTQSTGKFWKFVQLLGVLGILGAVTWAMVAQNSQTTAMCLTLGIPAAGMWAFGRVGAWWFHG